MASDALRLISLSAGVAALAVTAELLIRTTRFPGWAGRKVLHIGAVGACAAAPMLITDLLPLALIVVGAEVILLLLVGAGVFFAEGNTRRSWGIAMFPLAYLFLLARFPDDRWLIVLPMALLALADAAAAIAGKLFAKRFYTLTGDPKSWAGTIAFVAVAFVLCIAWGIWGGFGTPELSFSAWLAIGLVCALSLAAAEAMGVNGLDNLWVPLLAAALLQPMVSTDAYGRQVLLVVALLAMGFVGIMIKKQALKPDGAVAAALVGILVAAGKGPLALVPLALFLGSSLWIGKLKRRPVISSDAKEGKPRDAWQVIANGGLYALLALWNLEWAPVWMMASIAVSASDTWASEVGMAFRGPAYDILTWKRIPAGLSGGVSIIGTLGGAMGAVFMAASGWAVFGLSFGLQAFFLVAAAGFCGMLLDSILGAGLQARYHSPSDGLLSDQPGNGAALYSGFTWINNDHVNLISNALVTAAVGAVYFFC